LVDAGVTVILPGIGEGNLHLDRADAARSFVSGRPAPRPHGDSPERSARWLDEPRRLPGCGGSSHLAPSVGV